MEKINSYIVQKKVNNVWTNASIYLDESLAKEETERNEETRYVEDNPHFKAYLVSVDYSRQRVLCVNKEDYIKFISKFTKYTTEVIDIWLKGEEIMPKVIPNSAFIIRARNPVNLEYYPIYAALGNADLNDAMDWLQSNFPEIPIKLESEKVPVYNGK